MNLQYSKAESPSTGAGNDFGAVPDDLKKRQQWVLWKYGERDGKPTKLPINANTGRFADTTDPATWTTFENATARQNGNGLGYVFSADDPFTGIDFDACRDPESKVISQWAKDWIIKLNSYSEVSPSGTGIKVWVKAQWPMGTGKKKSVGEPELIPGKKPAVEAYDHARYFAVTGDRLDDLPAEPQERQGTIDELCREFFSEPAQSSYREEAKASRSSVVERARKYLDTIPGAISGTGGHNQTFHAACVLILGFGLTKPEALELLLEYNRRCEPPWSDRELQHKIDSADKQEGQRGYLRDKQKSESTSIYVPDYREDEELSRNTPDLLCYGFHDAGNAERIVAMYGAELRYCHAFRKWFFWDGRRWAVDETGRSLHMAKMMAVEFLRQATVAENAAAQKYARNSLNAKLLKCALELATPDLAVTPAELDIDPWFLNCSNGTVDLRSGTLLPHDPTRFISKLVNHRYEPASRCSTWQMFLYRIMGIEVDEDRAERMVRWLQKALGYSITGSTREKAMFVCHGATDTGKTTMTSAIRQIMPEYSTIIMIDSLMTRREETNNTQSDLADLRGARFAMTSETEAGQRLAVGKLKRITQGQGDIKAVRKYENPFTFKETHKLWLDANHKPVIRDTDDSIWNRVHLVPFEIQIPKAEQDRDLPTKLMAEAEGILAWLVAGAVKWYAEGLGKPPEVAAAGKAWREESDTIGDFIEDQCVMRPDSEVTNVALWKVYSAWCEQNGENTLPRKQFLGELIERGCSRARDGRGRKLKGIELKNLFSEKSDA